MAEVLHALMDSTDHVMEDGAPQKLEDGVSIPAHRVAVDGREAYSRGQPDLCSPEVSDEKRSRGDGKTHLQAPEPQIIPDHLGDVGFKTSKVKMRRQKTGNRRRAWMESEVPPGP